MISQLHKTNLLRDLHTNGEMLILPNVWDVLSAKLIESLGYKIIATASASVAYTNGFPDGENIPFEEVLKVLKKITASVNLPVTADIESGYATNEDELSNSIKKIIETGVAGINIEDTNRETKKLYTIEQQCRRIEIIKNVSRKMGIPLFINARADVMLHTQYFDSDEQIFNEIINRGLAYEKAGADCFFPIAIKNKREIEQLIDKINLPVNILIIPGIPDLPTLKKIGVARVSLGPSLLKIAIKSMKDLAIKLQNHEGLDLITGNEITNDYLKKLITGTN